MNLELATKLYIYNKDTGELFWKVADDIPKCLVNKLAGTYRKDIGYVISHKQVTYSRAHLIYLFETGHMPSHTIFHIDCDYQNDRWNNLIELSRSDIRHFKTTSNRNSHYKIPNVYYNHLCKTWIGNIKHKAQSIFYIENKDINKVIDKLNEFKQQMRKKILFRELSKKYPMATVNDVYALVATANTNYINIPHSATLC